MRTFGGTHHDQEFLEKSLNEVSPILEEPVTLLRFQSRDQTPDPAGEPRPATYLKIPTTAVIAELGIETTNFSHGTYAAGDIVLQMRIEPQHTDSQDHPGDRILWRGVEYRLVQRPMPYHVEGFLWWRVVARRVTPGG